MKWIIGFLVLSNLALWCMVHACMQAIKSWMDAATDLFREHQHVREVDRGDGFIERVLSGYSLSTHAEHKHDDP